MTKTFVLHDESINSYGFWMKTSGVDLTQFKKNPIMLYMHDRYQYLPIGRWDNIRVEGDKILADAVFDETDEFAVKIKNKVEGGFLKMASVGAYIVEFSSDEKNLKPGQTRETATKWRLREASIVDMGSNDNALALYDVEGKMIELNDGKDCGVKFLVNNEEKIMNKVFNHLQLADGASEEAVLLAIKEVEQKLGDAIAERNDAKKELEAFKTALKAKENESATKLVDAAIKDGRIDAGAKESILELFENSFEKGEKLLSSIPKRDKIAEQLVDKDKDIELYDRQTWFELYKNGHLEKIKKTYPDYYNQRKKQRQDTGK